MKFLRKYYKIINDWLDAEVNISIEDVLITTNNYTVFVIFISTLLILRILIKYMYL